MLVIAKFGSMKNSAPPTDVWFGRVFKSLGVEILINTCTSSHKVQDSLLQCMTVYEKPDENC